MKRPMECCGKAAAFAQRGRLGVKGHNEAVGAANNLFSETRRDVALRAILWSAAAKPQLSCSDYVWR